MGEGGADQRARQLGSAPGPVRRRPRIADSTRGRGRKTAGSTVRSSFTSQASCTSHARRAVGAAPGRRPQPVGDLALHHHRPAPHRGQLGDRAQDHRRRHRVGQVGDDGGRGGIEPGQVELERVAPVQVDVRAGGERRQRRLQPPVDLDRVHVSRGGGEALGQHAFPGAHLEHDLPRAQLGVAHDRVEQVGVGQEVLAEPDHLALPAEERPRVGLDRPLQLLVGDAAGLGDDLRRGDHVGRLVGLAAHRLRRQVGGVGLDQDELVGQLRGGLAQLAGAGEGDDRPRRSSTSRGRSRPATRQGARKQWRITATPSPRSSRIEKTSSTAPVSPSGSRAWITIGRSRSRGDLDLGLEGAPLVGPARRLAVVVDPGLADRPHLLVLGGEPGDLIGPGVVEAGRLGRVAAGGGEDALVALGGGDRLPVRLRVRPTLSIRTTPASCAAATSSASGCSQRKRWVWESITPLQTIRGAATRNGPPP